MEECHIYLCLNFALSREKTNVKRTEKKQKRDESAIDP